MEIFKRIFLIQTINNVFNWYAKFNYVLSFILFHCMHTFIYSIYCSVDVSALSCGPHHVVVVGGDGEVYSWGCGAGGRLGNGKEKNW